MGGNMANDGYPTGARNLVTDTEWSTLASHWSADGLITAPQSSGGLVAAVGSAWVVQPFSLIINGRVYTETASQTIPAVANASATPRHDVVVARIVNGRAMSTTVVLGSAGAGLPTINRNRAGTFDIPLGDVTASSAGYAVANDLRTWLTDDGQVLAANQLAVDTLGTAWSPDGRTYYDLNLDKYRIRWNGAWRNFFEDSGWIAIPPATGWTSAGGGATGAIAGIRRESGTIFITGSWQRSGTLTAGTADTLVAPAPGNSEYWPEKVVYGVCKAGAGFTQFTVEVDGTLHIQYPSVDMGTGTTVRLSCSWPAKV